MDNPKTRKEKKKDPKEKGQGKDGKYSQKHVRLATINQDIFILHQKKNNKV